MTHENGTSGGVGSTGGSAISPERYALIKPLPKEGGFFQNFPGVYCQKCGKDFALYSYSAYQPDGVDENGKPFYRECCLCCKTLPMLPTLQPNIRHEPRPTE